MLGSLRNNDDNGNKNGKKTIGLDLDHAFLYIS